MKKGFVKTLLGAGAVFGALVSLSSLIVLLRAVLHTQESALADVPGDIQIAGLHRALLLTLLAFGLCASGLAVFIRCVSRLIILLRTETRGHTE